MSGQAPRSESIVRPVVAPRVALGIAALCGVAFAGVLWLVACGAARPFDRHVLLMWRDAAGVPLGPRWLREGVRDITALGGVLLRNLFALAMVVTLLSLRRARQAAILTGAALSAWAVDGLVKGMVMRPRPQLVPHLTEAGGFSFPSGHSLNAAAIYLTAALIFAGFTPHRPARMAIIATGIAVVLAIGWSRVWLGVHWPSDVIAGWSIGGGCAALWVSLPWSWQAAPAQLRPPEPC